jgi:hypothetical protein
MKKKQLYDDMQLKIAARLTDLRQKDFSSLAEFPKYTDEAHQFGRWKYTLAVWCDRKSESLIQVVAQAYYHWILGIGTMMADGFRIQKDGSIVELPQEELQSFK